MSLLERLQEASPGAGFLPPEISASLVIHNADQEGHVSHGCLSKPTPPEGGHRLGMLWLGQTGFHQLSVYNVGRSLYFDDLFGSATLTSSSLHRQTAQEVEVCAQSQKKGGAEPRDKAQNHCALTPLDSCVHSLEHGRSFPLSSME